MKNCAVFQLFCSLLSSAYSAESQILRLVYAVQRKGKRGSAVSSYTNHDLHTDGSKVRDNRTWQSIAPQRRQV
jgi:hypothetical protein